MRMTRDNPFSSRTARRKVVRNGVSRIHLSEKGSHSTAHSGILPIAALQAMLTACLGCLLVASTAAALGRAARIDPVLACPKTKTALLREATVLGSIRTDVQTNRVTGARYPVNEIYVDLTPQREGPLGFSELASELLSQDVWSMQTGVFRTPAMAFIYERGWRQNFNAMGFPGPDKEFAELSDFFAPVADGGIDVDLSCGSGLMSRRLVRSGRYERVLALDYSEALLRETSRRFEEEAIESDRLTLVRADAAAAPAHRLPRCAARGRRAALLAAARDEPCRSVASPPTGRPLLRDDVLRERGDVLVAAADGARGDALLQGRGRARSAARAGGLPDRVARGAKGRARVCHHSRGVQGAQCC